MFKLTEEKTLKELEVDRSNMIRTLGGRRKRLFLLYRSLIMKELNKEIEKIVSS